MLPSVGEPGRQLRSIHVSREMWAWATGSGADLAEGPTWSLTGRFNRCDHKLDMVELGDGSKVW